MVDSTNIERSFVHGRKRKKKINFFGFYSRCSLCRKRFAIGIFLQVFACSEICDAFAVPKSVIALSNTANKQNLKKKRFLGCFSMEQDYIKEFGYIPVFVLCDLLKQPH